MGNWKMLFSVISHSKSECCGEKKKKMTYQFGIPVANLKGKLKSPTQL